MNVLRVREICMQVYSQVRKEDRASKAIDWRQLSKKKLKSKKMTTKMQGKYLCIN